MRIHCLTQSLDIFYNFHCVTKRTRDCNDEESGVMGGGSGPAGGVSLGSTNGEFHPNITVI